MVIPITISDDVFPEEAEQFEVILTASPGVFIDAPASAVVTILNDDPDLPGTHIKNHRCSCTGVLTNVRTKEHLSTQTPIQKISRSH